VYCASEKIGWCEVPKKLPRRKFLHLAVAQAVAAGDVVYRKAANQPPDRFMVGCATDNNQFHMYGEIK
jgi:hypothetical protein